MFCGGPFPEVPTAFVGPQENGPPSCPSIPHSSKVALGGLWMQPGEPPDDAVAVTTAAGETVLEERAAPDRGLRQIWYHHVFVEIGIGPESSIATISL